MSQGNSINHLSQANQKYINSYKTKTPKPAVKINNTPHDIFVNSKKQLKRPAFKDFLKGILISAAVIAPFIAIDNINPEKISKLIKKLRPFDNKKLFTEPISLEKYYQKMLDKIKGVKLNLSFDEAKVDDDTIVKCLRKIGIFDSDIEEYKQLVKAKPNLLHLLNVFSVFNSKTVSPFNYTLFDKIDNNISVDEIDLAGKFVTAFEGNFASKTGRKRLAAFEQKISCMLNTKKSPYKGIGSKFKIEDLLNNRKEIMGLSSILEEIYRKTGKKSAIRNHEYFIDALHLNPAKNPNADISEFLSFLETLKKGTLKQSSPYDIQRIFYGYESIEDFKKARKFYESLNGNVLKKLEIQDISDLLRVKDKNSVEISKILNNTPKNILKKLEAEDLPVYVVYNEYYGIDNIHQLSIEQKRVLLRKLVSTNSSTFASGKSVSKILPSNQREYCALMDKLAKSIGVDTKQLSKAEILSFNKTIKELAETIGSVDFNKATFELNFSRQDFIAEVEKKTAKLSDKEKIEVLDYFGFEIKDGKLIGYPINIDDNGRLNEISSPKVKKVITKVKDTVERFTSKDNKVTIKGASKEFNDSVNKLFESFPELKTMIQKAQHETHAFTLDIHVFKVLQNVCTNPKFKELSDDDKKVLEIASLLHDITKAEGLRDYMHPIESAFDAYYIIQKLNLPEGQQLKVYELIKTHNWLQQLNNPKNKDIIENIAQDIAFDSRHTNTFEMAKILCEADLKSVRKDASFFNSHKKNLQEMSAKVDGYIKQLHESQIVLPQTKIPKASEVINGTEKTADGISNVVIYMNSADPDLSKYGFSAGTTKENWTALVHALERPEQMSKFDTFSVIDTEALLSTSFINPDEYKVFRKQGLILDVNFNDIHAGYEMDFGTGYGKTLDILKEDYLFHGKRKSLTEKDLWRSDRSEYRTFISNKIREKMHLTPEEYYKRLEKIQDCKSITDIEAVDKELADGLLNVFKNMHAGKRRFGRAYNEMLVSRPKIQGVFAYDKSYEDIPVFLRKYASDNNLPIIIFG